MLELAPCLICDNQAEHDPGTEKWFERCRCPRCGEFEYEKSSRWNIASPDEMVLLSGWVREQNAAGNKPARITRETSRQIVRRRRPGLHERANRALSVIARKYPDMENATQYIRIAGDLEVQGVSYSRDQDDVMQLIHILIGGGLFRGLVDNVVGRPISGVLTPSGLLAAEALGVSGSNSAQGFVAMWFDLGMLDAWTNGFDPGIRTAGFRPFRIDSKDYVGGISDEIMAEIRRSRFVVADYTGQNNGVYFEAGFALGLGLRVIPTCRKDEVPKLHFDIKHLNTLLWSTPAELAEGLNRRIRGVIGVGPDAPDPE